MMGKSRLLPMTCHRRMIYGRTDFRCQPLTCLAACVAEVASSHVVGAELGHINERDAMSEETEIEQVAGKSEVMIGSEV